MTDKDPLRELWAADQGEKFTMSIAELTARSDRFRAQIKRRNWTEYLAALLVIGIFGWLAYIVPVWSVKIGAGLIIIAAIYISWQLNRVASLSADDEPADDLISTHRRQLVRQRDALRSVWRWYLLPFVPGIVVFSVGSTLEAGANAPLWAVLATSAVSLGFVGLVFAAVWAVNARAARKLDDEIKTLESVSDH
ncbi:MAG: hypothetical protein ACX94B_06095 [Henriciella sp.]|nr:hypothetical protein [Hyphomonadaceae bacterium]